MELGTDHQICPLTVLKPIHVLGGERFVKLIRTEAQNVIVIDEERMLWASDGLYDVRRDFVEKFMASAEARNIHDMWSEPDAKKEMKRSFDFGPRFPQLGVLMRDGAIYSIDQEAEPCTLIEKTSPINRRPFRHALIRGEVNNAKGDFWPCVVFEEKPRTIYRVHTVEDLLRWLDGATVQFSSFEFSSSIVRLQSCGGIRGANFMALTEDGEVFYWKRGTSMPHQTGTLSTVLQGSSNSEVSNASIDLEGNERTRVPQIMPISAIVRLVAGPTYGAAITRTGQLYVFLTVLPSHNSTDACDEPNLAELFIPGSDRPTVYAPYTPRLAKILDHDPQPTILDVAVGEKHLVALSSEGEVFTAGDGMHGQLGVGEAQFDLHAEMHESSGREDSWEFAERWQKIHISDEERARGGLDGETMSIEWVGAGFDSTLLIGGVR